MPDGLEEVRALALRLAEKEGADREWKKRFENLLDGVRRTMFGIKGDNGLVGDTIENRQAIDQQWREIGNLRKEMKAILLILEGDGGSIVGHAGRIRDLESIVRHAKFIILLSSGSGGALGFLLAKVLEAFGIGA